MNDATGGGGCWPLTDTPSSARSAAVSAGLSAATAGGGAKKCRLNGSYGMAAWSTGGSAGGGAPSPARRLDDTPITSPSLS